jgi:hypothetical protein
MPLLAVVLPKHIEDRPMTVSKFGLLNQPYGSTNTVELRRNMSVDACSVQQGVVEGNSSSAVTARIVPFDDSGEPGPESLVELYSCDGRGVSFHHQLPLSARRALISVDDKDFGRLEAEVNLSWCRFNHMGHYTSGGRFVQPADKIA